MGNYQPQKLIVQVTFNKPRSPFLFLLNGYNLKYMVHNKGSYMIVVVIITVDSSTEITEWHIV